MELTWYYYFSWWIFIWFILFELNIIHYSPYLIYCIAIVFITYKIVRVLIHLLFFNKKEIKNYTVLFGWFILIVAIDIIPFLLLKKEINAESKLFTILLLVIYLIFLRLININVIDLYNKLDYKDIIDNNYTLVSFFRGIFRL